MGIFNRISSSEKERQLSRDRNITGLLDGRKIHIVIFDSSCKIYYWTKIEGEDRSVRSVDELKMRYRYKRSMRLEVIAGEISNYYVELELCKISKKIKPHKVIRYNLKYSFDKEHIEEEKLEYKIPVKSEKIDLEFTKEKGYLKGIFLGNEIDLKKTFVSRGLK